VGVISAPDRPAGRGTNVRATPVAEFARAHDIELLQPERLRSPGSIEEVLALRPELGVLADYGQIVPRTILEAIPKGVLNLHPSLLPRHRGASPIPATILAGDEQTGVSLILMDVGIDSGPIVEVTKIPLTGAEFAADLEVRLAELAARLIKSSIGPWLAGSLPPRAQTERDVSLTKPLRRSDGRLDPRRPAAELERQVRAFQGWPGSFIESDAGRLIVLAGQVAPEIEAEPGLLVRDGAGLALATPIGGLRLEWVVPAGGHRMSGAELLRGRPGLAGSIVGPPAER
jgi:methionyl-tRNA formyltransferase